MQTWLTQISRLEKQGMGKLGPAHTLSTMSKKTEFKRAEDLQVGDCVRYLEPHPWVMVTEIRPYKGPLADIVFAIAETRPGIGFSLCRGDMVEVVVATKE